jgi:hypothetical protein
VNHDLLAFATLVVVLTLSGGVGTLQLIVLVLVLGVLAAVGLPQDTVHFLDVEGVGEELVSGDNVLNKEIKGQSWLVEIKTTTFFVFLHDISHASNGAWKTLQKSRTHLVNNHFGGV